MYITTQYTCKVSIKPTQRFSCSLFLVLLSISSDI